MLRLLVCGGRRYYDWAHVAAVLDTVASVKPVSLVIHGDAQGADSLAKRWAIERGIPHQPYPADWSKGKSAGPRRNQKMIDEGKPDGVVAFPGGNGTADMVARAKAANIKVWQPSRTPSTKVSE